MLTAAAMSSVVAIAGLAQSVERQALNLMVEGSSPSVGVLTLYLSILESIFILETELKTDNCHILTLLLYFNI